MDPTNRATRAIASIDKHLFWDGVHEHERKQHTPGLEISSYCPWSQRGFLKRAASFHWSWASRPKAVGVIMCARYGWRGDEGGDDSIICTACNKRLHLPWDEDLEYGATEIISQEYFEKISNLGHDACCSWRIRPCDTDICQAKYKSRQVERGLLLRRYDSLSSLHVNTPDEYVFNAKSLALLEIDSNGYNIGLLGLALMQWESADRTIICRFGCVAYPIYPAQDLFHPIENHSWYCPFIQSGGLDGFLEIWQQDKQKSRHGDYYPLLSKFTSEQLAKIIEN